jgi:hypothetical protein
LEVAFAQSKSALVFAGMIGTFQMRLEFQESEPSRVELTLRVKLSDLPPRYTLAIQKL